MTPRTEARVTLVPDQRFYPLLPGLRDRLNEIGAHIKPSNFSAFLDHTMHQVLELAFRSADADEGTVWLLSDGRDALVPAWNSGPNAQRFVNRFQQPLSSGIVSMVFANESPFLENQVWRNEMQGKSLDNMLGVRTLAMIACPFYFLGACHGVISCVQLGVPESETSAKRAFDEHDGAGIRHASGVLGRLIDNNVLRAVVGLKHG